MAEDAKPPVTETSQIVIAAPADAVWAALTDLRRWPDWNESVAKMEVDGPIEVGTSFQWVAGGSEISSRIEEMHEPTRIVWTGKTMGIRAVHEWQLEADGSQTKVTTTESFHGFIARLAPWVWRKVLQNALEQGLQALKKECEGSTKP